MANGKGTLSHCELEGVENIEKDKDNYEDILDRSTIFWSFFEVKGKGEVFIAKKLITSFLKPELRSKVVTQFREECALLSQLHHPNIVKFIEVYYEDITKTNPILVMEKLKCDLVQYIARNPDTKLCLKLSILQDVCRGLVYLHERTPSIVHGNLSAGNVCLSVRNRAKIIDFAAAKILNSKTLIDSCQIPQDAVSEKVDILAFGDLTLYLTIGDFPEGDNILINMRKQEIVEQQRRYESLQVMGSNNCLYDLTLNCLRDDPNERPSASYLLEYLEEKKKESDFNFEEAYKHFTDSKDVLELLSLKLMFLGPPRQGKSTTRRRVMKDLINLVSAGEEEKIYRSTGAVERGSSMVVKSKSSSGTSNEDSWSLVQSLNDEAHLLYRRLKDSLLANTLQAKAAVESTQTSSTEQSHSRENLQLIDQIHKALKKIKSLIKSRQSAPEHSSTSSATPVHHLPSLANQQSSHDRAKLHGYSELEEIFKNASEQPIFLDNALHSVKAYLRIEDTGGQPELMDMLPALTIGPGLYLLFFSYELKLDEEYPVFFQKDSGEKTDPEKSAFTLQEMLLCILSSISCSSASNCLRRIEKSDISDLSEVLESSKSVAFLVGTHKDKVSEEYIAEVDGQLEKGIRDTDFFKKDIVQFCSEDKLVVSLDNMRGKIEEIQQLYQLLEKAMKKHFNKIKIPAVWHLFSLCLRMRDVRTASMKTCLELSRTLNMTNEETKVALWFLHHHAGVLMYFPSVPDLEDLVIIDVQVVYDSITNIILNSMSFDDVGRARAERFKKTGQFTLKDLASATAGSSKDLIPPRKLVALLSYLHITAEILLNEVKSVTKEREYIMPCVLESTTSKELDVFHKEACRQHLVSLLSVYFTCGFTPMGLFPAMIACFISNKSFELVREGIKKNMVQFLFDSELRVTFISRVKFFEVIISCQLIFQHFIHIKCIDLKSAIENTLKEASSRMNYSSYMDYQFGFECSLHQGGGHLGCIRATNSVPKSMICYYNPDNPQPVDLQYRHLVWYGQEILNLGVPESTTRSPLSLFISVYPDLINSVKSCVLTVTDHCYSRRLISEDAYDHILQRSDWTDRDKARHLLSNVRSALSATPQALEDFVSVMSEVDDCKVMAEKIQKQMQ